jgi:hypothetical protein
VVLLSLEPIYPGEGPLWYVKRAAHLQFFTRFSWRLPSRLPERQIIALSDHWMWSRDWSVSNGLLSNRLYGRYIVCGQYNDYMTDSYKTRINSTCFFILHYKTCYFGKTCAETWNFSLPKKLDLRKTKIFRDRPSSFCSRYPNTCDRTKKMDYSWWSAPPMGLPVLHYMYWDYIAWKWQFLIGFHEFFLAKYA